MWSVAPSVHVVSVSRGNRRSGKSAIRLREVGPRMTLNLIKIEVWDGMVWSRCGMLHK